MTLRADGEATQVDPGKTLILAAKIQLSIDRYNTKQTYKRQCELDEKLPMMTVNFPDGCDERVKLS